MLSASTPREKAKEFNPIKTSKPKELIQFDTVHLDKKFGDSKFLLTAIDHFSKYGWAFLIEKINSENTRNCLEIVYKDCDFEIENVHTDNGTEFKKYFEQYLTQNSINRKLGAPYKPTSQGAVERFNRTIQDLLDKAYISKGKLTDFNLKNEITNILELYNNHFVHSTTGEKPAILFKETNEDILKVVIERRNKKIGYACKKKTTSLNLQENQYVLINDNVIFEKKQNFWYLPDVNHSTKNQKIVFSSLALIIALKENYIILQIIKSPIFQENSIILVKEEGLKIPKKEQIESIISG